MSLNCPGEPSLVFLPSSHGPWSPTSAQPCPSYAVGKSVPSPVPCWLANGTSRGWSWTWPIALHSSDGHWAVTTPCSCQPGPAHFAQEGAQLVRALPLPLHGQPPARLPSWSNHMLAAPWKWGWKVNYLMLILLMCSCKSNRQAPGHVHPGRLSTTEASGCLNPGVLLKDKDPPIETLPSGSYVLILHMPFYTL